MAWDPTSNKAAGSAIYHAGYWGGISSCLAHFITRRLHWWRLCVSHMTTLVLHTVVEAVAVRTARCCCMLCITFLCPHVGFCSLIYPSLTHSVQVQCTASRCCRTLLYIFCVFCCCANIADDCHLNLLFVTVEKCYPCYVCICVCVLAQPYIQ